MEDTENKSKTKTQNKQTNTHILRTPHQCKDWKIEIGGCLVAREESLLQHGRVLPGNEGAAGQTHRNR